MRKILIVATVLGSASIGLAFGPTAPLPTENHWPLLAVLVGALGSLGYLVYLFHRWHRSFHNRVVQNARAWGDELVRRGHGL